MNSPEYVKGLLNVIYKWCQDNLIKMNLIVSKKFKELTTNLATDFIALTSLLIAIFTFLLEHKINSLGEDVEDDAENELSWCYVNPAYQY